MWGTWVHGCMHTGIQYEPPASLLHKSTPALQSDRNPRGTSEANLPLFVTRKSNRPAHGVHWSFLLWKWKITYTAIKVKADPQAWVTKTNSFDGLPSTEGKLSRELLSDEIRRTQRIIQWLHKALPHLHSLPPGFALQLLTCPRLPTAKSSLPTCCLRTCSTQCPKRAQTKIWLLTFSGKDSRRSKPRAYDGHRFGPEANLEADNLRS